MKVFKVILQLLLLVVILGYVCYAAIYSASHVRHQVCKDVKVEIKDSTKYDFITSMEVDRLLNANNLNPRGMSRRDVNIGKIEQVIRQHAAVRDVKCYISPSGMLHIDIYQRKPLFRVMGMQSYFIDENGERMPLFANNAVYVPIVTGYVETTDIEALSSFVRFLQKNKFWSAQIEQIDVSPQKEIELSTRVGNQQLLLGKLENYEAKLKKMQTLYTGGLKDLNWNDYKKFDLRYKNQVIGIK